MIQDTSLDSFFHIQNTDELGKLQRIVFETIKANPNLTDKELAAECGLPINVFVPRRGELVNKRLIHCCGFVIQENGHRAMTWQAAED